MRSTKIKKILIAVFLVAIFASVAFTFLNKNKTPVKELSRREQIKKELIEKMLEDPKQTFSLYRKILENEPINHNECHGMVHEVGHEAFEIFGFDKAMEYQDGLCGSGYIHGVIEAKFGYLDTKNILNELSTICTDNKSACFHGVGHGLMIVNDLDITKSLEYCDKLTKIGQKNCYEGVWMHQFDLEETGARPENIMSTSSDIGKFGQDNEALCRNTLNKYKTSCYFYLPRIYAHVVEEPLFNLESLCGMIKINEYRVTCLVGTGHMFMKYHMANPITALRKCEQFKNIDWHASCKEGGVMYYLFDRTSSLENKIDNKNICQIFTDKRDKNICTFVAWERFNIK